MHEQLKAAWRGGVEGQVCGLREALKKAIRDQHADRCAVVYVLRVFCGCMLGWYVGSFKGMLGVVDHGDVMQSLCSINTPTEGDVYLVFGRPRWVEEKGEAQPANGTEARARVAW